MMAVILLAGQGTRLGSQIPKSLVNIGNKPLLWFSITNLIRCNVDEFVFVIGFKSRMISNFINSYFPRISAKFIYNPRYNSTGSVYSYFLSKKYFLKKKYFRLEGDLLYSYGILTTLSRSRYSVTSAVENKIKKSFEEYSVKVNTHKKIILKFGKDIQKKAAFGEAKGIEYITDKGSEMISRSLEDMISRRESNQYAEIAYQNIIDVGGKIHYSLLEKSDFWCEIDTQEDLEFARKNIHRWYETNR